MTPIARASGIRSGRVTLLPAQRRVLVDDEPARLGGRAFDLLRALATRQGEIVAKRELLDAVWPGIVVEENNLQVQICALRKLLGSQAIVTVPGRGYSFSGVVDVVDRERAIPIAPHHGPAPTGLTALRGRASELAALASLLQQQRMVTVTGPGGVGKSRLVQAALGPDVDKASPVELESMPERVTMAAWVALAFGLDFARTPSARQVASALAGMSTTLVVENAERGTEQLGELAEALLDQAPGLRLVCTSQVPLKARGEHVLRLAPLELPVADDAPDALQTPALQLLMDAVSTLQAREGFRGKEAQDAAAICRHLDGMPHAIELAAARIPLLGVAGVRRMLAGDRFRLLTNGGRRTARQRSLHASMEWSWSLLTTREREALAAISRFPGRFTLGMARQALASAAPTDWDAMEVLGALVDKSLVLAESGSRSVFRLLETTRLFAQDRMVQGQLRRPTSG